MTVTAIITVTSCLLLFGVFMLFSINMNYIGEQIRNQCQIQAFIEFEADTAREQAVVARVMALDNVERCEFISKSQAMEEYRAMLGLDAGALDDLDGEEFLRSSVKIDMTDLEQAEALVAELSKIPDIAKVQNRQDLVRRIISVTNVVQKASLAAMLILLVVAIFIISNTIKLSVVARRDEVHIMKYVGATAGFIRRPFVLEGVLTGILGGLISLGIVGVGYNAAVNYMKDFLDIFDLFPFMQMLPFIAGTTIIFGVIMGAIGSAFALVKHLKV